MHWLVEMRDLEFILNWHQHHDPVQIPIAIKMLHAFSMAMNLFTLEMDELLHITIGKDIQTLNLQ